MTNYEYAAKAAGYEVKFATDRWWIDRSKNNQWRLWRPMDDVLKLAFDAGINVDCYGNGSATVTGFSEERRLIFSRDVSSVEALRNAVFDAAVAKGRDMMGVPS